MDALLDVSEELNEGLLTLTDHQAYMRRREEHHAAVLESTRARVLWRTVGFAIRASVHHPSTDGEGSMDALLDVSEELNEGLLTLTDHQAYMRRREEHHAAVLESTRARVLWWTVAETAVLIALSLWQILTVRAFFETKRRL